MTRWVIKWTPEEHDTAAETADMQGIYLSVGRPKIEEHIQWAREGSKKPVAHLSNMQLRPCSGERSSWRAWPVATSATHSSSGCLGGSPGPPAHQIFKSATFTVRRITIVCIVCLPASGKQEGTLQAGSPGLRTVNAMCLESSDQEVRLIQEPSGWPWMGVSLSGGAGSTRSSVKSTRHMPASADVGQDHS